MDKTDEESLHKAIGESQLQLRTPARFCKVQLSHGENNKEFGRLFGRETFGIP